MNQENKLKIGEKLAEGATSVIHRGEFGSLPVIVKRLRPEHHNSMEIARLRFEYNVLSPIKSKLICTPLTLMEAAGVPILILPDIGALALNVFSANTRLPTEKILHIGVQVAKALEVIHEQGIIHKDINPSNIVFNERTNEVQLIDFGIASKLSIESQALQPVSNLEGTLLFLSPEQTGRMNRSIDKRTDFYSLGATLFQLATGHPPFNGEDASGIVHAILAAKPIEPKKINADIPAVLSAIILKLLDKDPKQRYCSAYGLIRDLQRCHQEFLELGTIADFALGAADHSETFQIPEKIYGRDNQIDELLTAFARVSQGARELVLIPGPSGIGKSALVSEVQKPLVGKRGYFISGKFDQFKKNMPYYAMTAAFENFVSQILREKEEDLRKWQATILAACQNEGHALIEVIPAFAKLLGPQPALTELDGDRAKRRLNELFLRVARAISTQEHPLVLFLDDMQWADSGSLELLRNFIEDQNLCYLLVIVAYRDNEVSPNHPFVATLSKVQKTSVKISEIKLAALPTPALRQFIADTINRTPEQCALLAETIHDKTQGNPFFIKTFLKYLHEKHLLSYSPSDHQWHWDIAKIKEQQTTENVVEILLEKMSDLDAQARKTIHYAACIGPRFDLEILSLLLAVPPKQAVAGLRDVVKEGFVVPLSREYRFVSEVAPSNRDETTFSPGSIVFRFAHDRIQQAAHALFPTDEQGATHYRMGKLLLASTTKQHMKERIFDIADHLNYGLPSITSTQDKRELAEINLAAGQQAHAASAFEHAVIYFDKCIQVMGSRAWEDYYDLAAEVHLALGRSHASLAHFDEGIKMVEGFVTKLKTPIQKGRAYAILAIIFEQLGEHQKVINACITGLRELNFRITNRGTYFELAVEIIKLNLNKRKIIKYVQQGLAYGRPLQDERWKLIIQLSMRSVPATFLVNPNLLLILIPTVFRAAMRAKVWLDDATLVSGLSSILAITKSLKASVKLKQMALQHAQGVKLESPFFYNNAGHWCICDQSFKQTVVESEKQHDMGFEKGEINDITIGAFFTMLNGFGGGYRIEELLELETRYRQIFLTNRSSYLFAFYFSTVQTIKAMAGLTTSSDSMTDADLTEEEIITRARGKGDVAIYKFFRTFLDFHGGHYQKAAREGFKNPNYLVLLGCFTVPLNLSISCISLIRSHLEGNPGFKSRIFSRIIIALAKVELWWWDRNYLAAGRGHIDYVNAEIAMWRGRFSQALALYEKALQKFKDAEAYYFVASVHEALGQLYAKMNYDVPAASYIREAIDQYTRYGAASKAAKIESDFRWLLDRVVAVRALSGKTMQKQSLVRTNLAGSGNLDVESIVKASLAISGEMNLSQLVKQILYITMENAGATAGALLIKEKNELVIRAFGNFNHMKFEGNLAFVPLQDDRNELVPDNLILFVSRTGEPMILNDHKSFAAFDISTYLKKNAPKSIFCMPITSQGDLKAILYLENNLIENAFTKDRVETLKILGSQGAISLHNARYFQDIFNLKKHLEKILDGTKSMAASDSVDKAIMHAFKAMREEFDSFRNAKCGVIVRDQNHETYLLKDVTAEGRLSDGMALSESKTNPWIQYLNLKSYKEVKPGTLVFPIGWEQETHGLFIIENIMTGLSPEAIQFVETLCQSLGLSMQNLEYREHLEDLVEDRTSALDAALKQVSAKQRKVQAIMDHIDQGILTFDNKLVVESEFSAYLPRIFNASADKIRGADVLRLVFHGSSLTTDELNRIHQILNVTVGENEISWELNGRGLPSKFTTVFGNQTRIIGVQWNPIWDENGLMAKMMLILQDLTDQIALEKEAQQARERQQRKMAAVGEMLSVDRLQLTRFIQDTENRINNIYGHIEKLELTSLFRHLHTIKGAAGTLGFKSLATRAHDAESVLPDPAQARAEFIKPKILDVFGLLVEEFRFYEDVYTQVFAPRAEGTAWSLHSLTPSFSKRILELVDKQSIPYGGIHVSDQIGYWPVELQNLLSSVLPHCVNNALDHGYLQAHLEGTETRPIDITINALEKAGKIAVVVEDRGVGLNHDKIRKLAKKRGVDKQHYLEVLFQDGVSTSDKITLTSGRGVGLGAVRELLREVGGEIKITDRPGGGTRCVIELPLMATLEKVS